MRRACDGDCSAVELLYRRYKDGVYSCLLGLIGQWDVAEELLQEVFVSFLHKHPRFSSDASLQAWFYVSARHKAFNHLRRKKEASLSPDVRDGLVAREALGDAVTEQELRGRVQEGLAKLPPAQREVILLRLFQRMTFAQIEAIVGEPLETIEGQVEAMVGGSEDIQKKIFLQHMKKLDKALEEVGKALDAWARGDASAMEEITYAGVREQPELKPAYDAMLDHRNEAMSKEIQKFLGQKGTYFVAVGSAHLVGKKGIVALLGEAGVKVRQLIKTPVKEPVLVGGSD
ncbi:MAG: sigma-70 family RNA polymerase sigma factor [Planctomycetes bacterium]|nr:sigma-70 family RNA polymerase sigma factor [Planctomycetota bacterium]